MQIFLKSSNSLFSASDRSSTEVADMYNVVSSAYIETFALFKAKGRSFVNIVDSSDPRQLPCGILDNTFIELDSPPLKKTVCDLPDNCYSSKLLQRMRRLSLIIIGDL